jgi:endonuclease III
MPFIKGRSGNPRGRPVGARGKKTLAREAALQAKAEAEAQAVIDRWLGAHGRACCKRRARRNRRPRGCPRTLSRTTRSRPPP